MMRVAVVAALALACVTIAPRANGQHLIWKPKQEAAKATCLYGEIEVLATGPTIYYCGCNWWPGNPAGGYCGIQDAGGGRRLMIFSIWDTSPTLHPQTIEADPRAKYSRFGGEGTGAHTHLDYDWPLKKTFRYYVTKEQSSDGAATLTRMYYYDEGARKWVHEATISNPNDGHEAVRTFGGMLNSFLENWSGRERATPKLALYRLWLGTTPKDLISVTEARGDGRWGVLNGSFFLAEGEASALDTIILSARQPDAPFAEGPKGRAPVSVPERRIPERTIQELERLPRSPKPPDEIGTAVRSYSTRFAASEEPISEGGRWANGGKDGLDWFDVVLENGVAHGKVATGAYTDPTALLTGEWGPNQAVKATVFSRNQTEKYYQEVEIRLRSAISPHRCTGYEVFWRCLKTGSAYVEIVRWNGKLGDWTSLNKRTGAEFGVKDGDVVEARIVGNVIKGYLNGVEVISATDDTYPSGSPGMGFNYGVERTNADFGFTSYEVRTYKSAR